MLAVERLSASLASNAIARTAAAFTPNVKIKPVQRLKMLSWVKTAGVLRTPLNQQAKSRACKWQKTGSNIPLNLLGGYRWSNAVSVDPAVLRTIIHCEVGG
jgi:hypothetical protein